MKVSLIIIVLFFSKQIFSQIAFIKDLNNNGSQFSNPSSFTESNGKVFFLANDCLHGTEMWVTDGTSSGTNLLKDIAAGSRDGIYFTLTNFNNKLYFGAFSNFYGDEPWMSDGTDSGTVMISDWNPGNANGGAYCAAFDSILFHVANNGTYYGVYRTDGTTNVSTLIYQLDSLSIFKKFIKFNNELYFVTYSSMSGPMNGCHLLKTNGSSSGTIDMGIVFPNSLLLSEIVASPGFIYSVTSGGNYIYTTNGTYDDYDFIYKSGMYKPHNLTPVGSTIYFLAANSSTSSNYQLWKTDGTNAGTSMIMDINPTGDDDIESMYAWNGKLYFSAQSNSMNKELWVSDGTTVGTHIVRDLAEATTGGNPRNFCEHNGLLYFAAYNDSLGTELWVTNGDSAGTTIVADICPGSCSSMPENITSSLGVIFFSANGELWKSDGTAAGTTLVKDINSLNNNSNICEFFCFNDTMYFQASDGINGSELWKSDGSSIGTNMLLSISPGLTNSYPKNFTQLNGDFYFNAFKSNVGYELYVSNGSSSGTRMIRNEDSVSVDFNPKILSAFNNNIIFSGDAGPGFGTELCVSDCTQTGTALLHNINPTGDSNPFGATIFNGSLYFGATTNTLGSELYKIDSTLQLSLIKDIYTGTSSSYPAMKLNGILDSVFIFSATDVTTKCNLFRSDGTTSGTIKISNIEFPSYLSFNPTRLNDCLIFSAKTSSTGVELFKTDGTDTGTVLISDIFPGSENSNPQNIVAILGTIYFSATDDTHGCEIFKSDGSSLGTMILADIAPGQTESIPSNFTVLDSVLYFTADDGINGKEIWRTDGSIGGTFMVGETFPGSGDGGIDLMCANSEFLFFRANKDSVGKELWKYDPLYTTIVTPPKAEFCVDDNFQVCYKAWGKFNPGNYFIAELSDSSGSFNNPISLDSISGINSGIISTQIPQFITGGSNYKVRVRTTNPPSYYGTNSENIKIHKSAAFIELQDSLLCVNWAPVNYSGIPAGGIFWGDTMPGNFFNPAISGAGTFVIHYLYSDQFGCDSEDSVIIVVEECVSLDEDKLINLTVSPNPTDGVIFIRIDDTMPYTFEVYNCQGSKVNSGNLLGNKTTNEVNLKMLDNGIYFLKITNKKNSLTYKIQILK